MHSGSQYMGRLLLLKCAGGVTCKERTGCLQLSKRRSRTQAQIRPPYAGFGRQTCPCKPAFLGSSFWNACLGLWFFFCSAGNTNSSSLGALLGGAWASFSSRRADLRLAARTAYISKSLASKCLGKTVAGRCARTQGSNKALTAFS